jgi:hypothetical protein
MKVILFTFVKFQMSNVKSQISNLQCPLLANGHNVSGFLAEDDDGQVIAGEEVFRERHVGS